MELYFKAKADFEEVIRLRNEIIRLQEVLAKSDKTDVKLHKKLTNQINETQTKYDKLTEKVAKNSSALSKSKQTAEITAIGFKNLAGALSLVGGSAALIMLNKRIIETRGEFQQLEIAFTTLLQSKERADKLMAQMVETAAKTPFDLKGVANGARQLIAYGFEAEKVNETLIRLGNVAAGLGLPLERLTYLYGTTMVQGRVYARDMLQFTNSGIPLLAEMAKMYGKTTKEINDMVSAGKIGFADVEKVITKMTDKGGQFYNLMQEQSKSLTGQISNLQDAIDVAMNEMGKSTQGFASKALEITTTLVENWEKVGKMILSLIATYGTYKTALIVTSVAQTGFNNLQMMTGVVLARVNKAFKALTVTMNSNPYALMATLVVGLATTLWSLRDNTSEQEKAQKRLNKVLDEAKNRKEAFKNKTDVLINTLKSETSSIYDQIEAYRKLIKLMPERLKGKSFYDVMRMSAEELQKLSGEKQQEDDKAFKQKQYEAHLKRIKELEDGIKDARKSGQISTNQLVSGYQKEIEKHKKDAENLKKQLNEIQSIEKEAAFRSLSKDEQVERLKSQREALLRQKNLLQGNKSINPFTIDKNTAKNLSDIDEQINKLNKSIESYNTKSADKNYAYWENIKKTAEDARKKLGEDKIGSDEWKKLTAQIKEADKALKKYSDTEKTNTSKRDKDKALREAQLKADAQHRLNEQKQQAANDAKKAELDIKQSEIDGMREGFAKKNAQIELEKKRELQSIEERKQALIKANREAARAEWEVSGKKGVFNQTVGLTSEQQAEIDSRKDAAAQKELRDKEQLFNELLEQYKDYATRREEIESKLNKDLSILNSQRTEDNKIQIDAAIAEAKRLAEEQIKSLNFEEFQKTDLWQKMFSDLGKMTSSSIQKILNEAKKVDTSGWKPSDIKAYQEALDNLEDAINTRNPFMAISNGWAEMMEGIKNNDRDAIAKGLKKISDAVDQTVEHLRAFSDAVGVIFGKDSGIADSFETATEIAGAIAGIGSAAAKFASSDVIGGVKDAVKSIASIFSLHKQAKESERKAKEALKKWQDNVIAGKMEYQALVRERLRLERQAGETALQYQKRITEELLKQKKQIKDDYNTVLNALNKEQFIKGKKTEKYGGFLGFGRKTRVVDSYGSLLGKSFDDIERLDKQGKLTDKAKELFEQLRKLKEEGENVDKMLDDNKQAWKESLAGLSFDELRNSFKDMMRDGRIETKELADYMKSVFQKAIIEGLMVKYFDNDLQKLVDEMLADAEAGTYESKRDYYEQRAKIISEGMNQMLEPFSGLFKDTQSAASKGAFSAASQESITELNGRFTDFQMSNREILAENKLMTAIQNYTLEAVKLGNDIQDETRLINQTIAKHIALISGHTKSLPAMEEHLEKIKKNTDKL